MKSTTMATEKYTYRYGFDISKVLKLPVSVVSVRVANLSSPSQRAPVFEEVYNDMKIVIAKQAKIYCDASCPSLCYEELVNEGNLKIAEMIDSGRFHTFPNRIQFFRFFKTVIANMFRSLVQRHRGTQKRTGIVQPKKHTGESLIKPQETRLDDENVNFDVASDVDTSPELFEQICSYVTPVEKLVLKEEVEPSLGAHCLAYLDAVHGLPEDSPVNVRISRKHKAESLGMEEALYTELLKSSRIKIRRRMSEKNQKMDESIARLSAIFGVQVPPYMEISVVRRLFSLAARQQYDSKVHGNDETIKLLEYIGAVVPEVRQNGKVMSCFGVLFLKNNHVCNSCYAMEACEAKAANLGLGEMVISRRLLSPTRNQRVPVIMARGDSKPEPAPQMERDKALLDYLGSNFRRYDTKGQIFYAHKERLRTSSPVHLFCLGKSTLPLELRFIAPEGSLLTKLEMVRTGRHKNWYLKSATTLEEALELIKAHSTHVYERNTDKA